MQCPGNGLCEMLVIDYIGFKFKHQQQDDPGQRVNCGRVRFHEIRDANAVRISQWRCGKFLGEEQVDVCREKHVNRVFEKLEQPAAVDRQTVGPPEVARFYVRRKTERNG